MPQATSQQTELYALIQAYNLIRGKTANIYTDSGCIFGIAHDFGMFWKQSILDYFWTKDLKSSYGAEVLEANPIF